MIVHITVILRTFDLYSAIYILEIIDTLDRCTGKAFKLKSLLSSMISLEDRQKPIIIRDIRHLFYGYKKRGKFLFGDANSKTMHQECLDAIKNNKKSVFVENKLKKDSTHYCMFITDNKGYACLPCLIDEKNIILITIMNIREAEKPQGFIRQYNEIANTRDLPRMNLIFKTTKD